MPIQMWLPDPQFDYVIRLIKRSKIENVEMLAGGARTRLKELKSKPKPEMAVKGVPDGSDSVDVGSILTWMNKIEYKKKGFNKALRQLQAIEATATKRLTE